MTQQFTQQPQQIKKRNSVLVFLKGSTTPIALYVEKPKETIEELQNLMKGSTAVLVDKVANGPLKRVSFMSNQILALAIQEEQYV